MESILVGLATIIVLGIGAQWLAWRLKLPAILFLLLIGFLAGPVVGILDPDALLGDLLFPLVSLSVQGDADTRQGELEAAQTGA